MNPGNYTQVYHLNAVDTSMSHMPEVKAEYTNIWIRIRPDWLQGWLVLARSFAIYYYNQYRLNPKAGAAPLLSNVGTTPVNVPLYDGEGRRCS